MKIYFQKQTLNNKKNINQFVRAILCAIRFDKINEKEICKKTDLTKKKVLTKSL